VVEALRNKVPCLGVCLGAQLLSVAAGGFGYRSSTPEVGWTEVFAAPECSDDPLLREVPPRLHVMSSHLEQVSLPEGATRLMSSDPCPNQAFRVGDTAWGMQFHPEADAAFAATRRRLVPGWAQAESPVDGDARLFERRATVVFAAVFSRFAQLIGATAHPAR
jgi:GMP synthase-like glutamine amidotransferase